MGNLNYWPAKEMRKSMSIKAAAPERNERVRALAHKLWEEEGCPKGRAEAHWLRAEEIVAKETAKPAKKKAAPRGKAKKS